MPVDPLNDQMQYRDGKLPVDRLRDGTMTDAEVLRIAAETVALSYEREPNEVLTALARRLKLVRLAEPHQTRARSLYMPKPKPDGGRIHG